MKSELDVSGSFYPGSNNLKANIKLLMDLEAVRQG